MNVDIEKTKKYYASLEPDAICDCEWCQNYYMQIEEKHPDAVAYLVSLGIDVKKPFDTQPSKNPFEESLVYYHPQYIVFGSCPDTYNHKIGDVEIYVTEAHRDTEIEEEHFVLEIRHIEFEDLVP
jgi:hypothetical protein